VAAGSMRSSISLASFERGTIPEGKRLLFKGESNRKGLGIPMHRGKGQSV